MALFIHNHRSLPRPFISLSEPTIEVGENSVVQSSRAKLLFFLGGDALLQIDDREPVRVREGSLAVLPRPCRQTYLNPTGKACRIHAYCIRFLPQRDRKQKFSRNTQYYERITGLLFSSFATPRIVTDGISARLRQQLLLLRNELEEGDAASPVMIFSLALSLSVETARLLDSNQAASEAVKSRRKARSLVNGALEYMARNLRDNLTLEKIAWALKVSEEHLCRTFRRECGQTPREALRKLQIDEAKNLLINSQHEIQQIAELAGFSSSNSFCRFFRDHCRSTPTEYRFANRGEFRPPGPYEPNDVGSSGTKPVKKRLKPLP